MIYDQSRLVPPGVPDTPIAPGISQLASTLGEYALPPVVRGKGRLFVTLLNASSRVFGRSGGRNSERAVNQRTEATAPLLGAPLLGAPPVAALPAVNGTAEHARPEVGEAVSP